MRHPTPPHQAGRAPAAPAGAPARTIPRRTQLSATIFGLAAMGLVVTTACGNGSAAPEPATDDAPTTQDALLVTIVGDDSMRFAPSAITVEAGRPVRLTLRNDGRIPHDFTLTEGVRRRVSVVAGPGQSASATFTVERPGTYRFVCAQPGHAQAGMVGTITAQ